MRHLTKSRGRIDGNGLMDDVVEHKVAEVDVVDEVAADVAPIFVAPMLRCKPSSLARSLTWS
jgi:hypothetical protein